MRNRFQVQISFATAFSVLTSGVFLSGLAVMMGAGDVLTSYISVIMNICGAMIIFFAPFIERFKSRKKITLILTVLSKIATILIVFIPVLVPKSLQLFFFVPLIIIAFSFQAQAQVSLNNWLVYFVDKEKSGRYISLRMTFQLIITILLSISAGSFIDKAEGQYIAFALIFGIASIMALFEILTLIKIDDVKKAGTVNKKYSLKDMILIPLKNKEFMGFVIYISLFYFLLYVADSFTIVYLLKYLKLSYTEITLFQQLFMSLPQLFLLSFWGRSSDKRGHKTVLHRCIWFFALELLFVMLSAKDTVIIFLPLAFTFAAIANSGFNVAVFNRRYELIPEEGRIIHDNFYHAAVGISLILGPVTGGTIKDFIAGSGVASGIEFGEFRLLYALSFIGIILLQVFNLKRNKR